MIISWSEPQSTEQIMLQVTSLLFIVYVVPELYQR